jgi:TctA family transporter
VLGDMAETAFRQSMLLSGGSVAIFWSNWLVGTIMTLAVVLLLWPLVSVARETLRRREAAADGRARA